MAWWGGLSGWLQVEHHVAVVDRDAEAREEAAADDSQYWLMSAIREELLGGNICSVVADGERDERPGYRPFRIKAGNMDDPCHASASVAVVNEGHPLPFRYKQVLAGP